jgi:hypothetical protein
MTELTDEIKDRLNRIGLGFGDIAGFSRIMQACIEDEENLQNGDIEIIFEILKLKIIEIKNDFNQIQSELQI